LLHEKGVFPLLLQRWRKEGSGSYENLFDTTTTRKRLKIRDEHGDGEEKIARVG
jgi:hypothetical protein